MATLHLVCGLPGAGKTTRALALAAGGAARFCPDEALRAAGHHFYDHAARDAVEARHWAEALALLARGRDVVLENGFWSRAERDRLRVEAAAAGATVRLHACTAPLDELKRRIVARNRGLPPTERVDPADLDGWAALYEPPAADELG